MFRRDKWNSGEEDEAMLAEAEGIAHPVMAADEQAKWEQFYAVEWVTDEQAQRGRAILLLHSTTDLAFDEIVARVDARGE